MGLCKRDNSTVLFDWNKNKGLKLGTDLFVLAIRTYFLNENSNYIVNKYTFSSVSGSETKRRSSLKR